MLNSHRILIALFAAAAITAVDSTMNEPDASVGTPPVKSEARLSDAAQVVPSVLRGSVAVAEETKAAMLDSARPCERQIWPHISARCLVAADGAAPRVTRMITVEHRSATGSDLMRMKGPRLVGY